MSFSSLEGEGELGPGLALAEDYFLLLFLLLLTVLLQFHALLVNLSLLLNNSQLLFSLLESRGFKQEGQTRTGNKTESTFFISPYDPTLESAHLFMCSYLLQPQVTLLCRLMCIKYWTGTHS